MTWRGKCSSALMVIAALALPAANAQTIRSVDELMVVDAAGKRVGGKLVDAGAEKDRAYVTFQLDTNVSVFKLGVSADRLIASDDLNFESADCSGTPYISTSSFEPRSVFARTGIAPPGHTLFVEDVGAPSRAITVRSQLASEDGTCQNGGGEFSEEVAPLLKTQDLDALFTAPFHLVVPQAPGAACCGDCNEDQTVTINEIITSVNYALGECPAQ